MSLDSMIIAIILITLTLMYLVSKLRIVKNIRSRFCKNFRIKNLLNLFLVSGVLSLLTAIPTHEELWCLFNKNEYRKETFIIIDIDTYIESNYEGTGIYTYRCYVGKINRSPEILKDGGKYSIGAEIDVWYNPIIDSTSKYRVMIYREEFFNDLLSRVKSTFLFIFLMAFSIGSIGYYLER